ncbi:MAG TPA: glycosyltransferase family 39 protein [Blastocatellia bacterium]|nr:glycosyltransferase family 39 protein [Blastocatellia bacterium]
MQKTAGELEIIDERSHAAKRGIYLLAAIVAVCALTFFFGAGRLALTGPDEPRYAEVAREMFVTGDYITPRLAGCVWFEKPVLVYWMAAASYRLFGVGEFAARFPSATSAFIACLALYFGMRRSTSREWAAASSLALATTGLFIGFARSITMDMALASAIALALISGYKATESERRARLLYWAGCGAATALGCLAKGFVAILLVGAIMGLYLLVAGRLRRIGLRELMIAAAAIVAVAGSWYVPVTLRHGDLFIDEFIIEHHFQRYITPIHNHPQPAYFYLFVIFAGLMPWTFLLVPAVSRIRTLRPREDCMDTLLVFAWIWLAVPLLFFSFSSSKLPGYIVPVFPALAIIVGAELERIWNGYRAGLSRAALWITALLLLAIGIAFILYLESQDVATEGWQLLIRFTPLALGILAFIMLLRSQARRFLFAAGGVVILVVVGSVVVLLPRLSETLSHKNLSLEAASQLRPGEKMGLFIMKEFAPVFYGEGRMVCGTGDGTLMNALHPDRLVSVLERESSIIVLTEKRWVERLEEDERLSLEMIGEQRKAVALRVSLRSVSP